MTVTDSSLSFPPRLHLARLPTPLQALDRLSEALGGPRIWIKRDDLTGSLLSGNKVRKLEFVVAQALAEGCNHLLTCGGEQSNHCRATAVVAAQLGLKATLLLRRDGRGEVDGNLLIDHLAGAAIELYESSRFRRELPSLLQQRAEKIAKQGDKPFIIPTGASDEIGVWGYLAACEELRADFQQHRIAPDTIVLATGSGGTQAGLTLGAQLYQLPSQVLGMAVCDSERWFVNKVTRDLESWRHRYQGGDDLPPLNILVNDNYIGPGYAKATQPVFDTIRTLASLEGIFLDPVYTGKAFYGLMEEIKKGHFAGQSDVVFIHTGGIFGIFPQREQIIS